MSVILKLNQYFCKHDYKYLAKNKHINENLWWCPKCRVYYVQYWMLGIGFKCKLPRFNDYLGGKRL